MDAVLAEMIKSGVVEVIGEWDDGEPELRVAELGRPILLRMDEAEQARYRTVLDAEFCGNRRCGVRIRPGRHYLRVTLAAETADVARPDLRDGPVWSGIFCTAGCAREQTDTVLLNYDASIDPSFRREP
jgi:hypothetical protein